MKKIFFKHALFETGRRRINSVFLKKRGEAEPSQAPRILLPFPKELDFLFHFHSRVPMCFRALFLGTHTRKKDNGNSNMNYFIFIYELNSNRKTCPTETEFVTCYPLA